MAAPAPDPIPPEIPVEPVLELTDDEKTKQKFDHLCLSLNHCINNRDTTLLSLHAITRIIADAELLWPKVSTRNDQSLNNYLKKEYKITTFPAFKKHIDERIAVEAMRREYQSPPPSSDYNQRIIDEHKELAPPPKKKRKKNHHTKQNPPPIPVPSVDNEVCYCFRFTWKGSFYLFYIYIFLLHIIQFYHLSFMFFYEH